jgi:hypothetical protein
MSAPPTSRPRHLQARKLLGVSLGVATVSLLGSACACTTGNLVAPPPDANFIEDAGPRTDAPEERDAAPDAPAESDGGSRKP